MSFLLKKIDSNIRFNYVMHYCPVKVCLNLVTLTINLVCKMVILVHFNKQKKIFPTKYVGGICLCLVAGPCDVYV